MLYLQLKTSNGRKSLITRHRQEIKKTIFLSLRLYFIFFISKQTMKKETKFLYQLLNKEFVELHERSIYIYCVCVYDFVCVREIFLKHIVN